MARRLPSIGVLLMAFGGPNSVEEVEPFLQNVLGRGISAQRLHGLRERYRLIGGGSPLLEITLKQARRLENSLLGKDTKVKVYVGMKHWHPFIAETLGQILKDGIHRVVALSLTPFQSKMSTQLYILELRQAVTASKMRMEVSVVEGWHIHPIFLQALAERVQEGLNQFPIEVRHRVPVVFSAHSLPKKAITGDPYVEQIGETVRGIIGITGPLHWRLAFQSGGGNRGEWLGPEMSTILRELVEKGHREVIIAPVGFVADNVETLYDIDIFYKQQAEAMGMSFQRSPCLNDSDRFIEALSAIVREHLANETWSSHYEIEVER